MSGAERGDGRGPETGNNIGGNTIQPPGGGAREAGGARPEGAIRIAPVLVGLAALLALRLLVAGTTDVVEDEAYYWVWSQHLAAGYYDHPPGVAWMIAASDALFGATSLGVRGAGVLLGVAVTALLVPSSPRPGLALLLLGALPLYTLGGVLATPDVPLLFGWALALAGAIRGGPGWLLVGVGAGIAGLGKYTGWGLWPLLLAFLAHEAGLRAMDPRGAAATGAPARSSRGELPYVLGGLALTLLLLAPNLVWNAEHDWISVRFQAGHGLGGEGATSKAPPGPGGLLVFLAGQAALVSPVLFVAMLVFFAMGWRGDRLDRLLWWSSAPVLVFFALAATRAQSEPNWAAPAWAAACLGLARGGPRMVRAAWVGGGFAAILSALVLLHVAVPLVDVPGDPTARLGLGRTLADSVQAWGIEPVYTTRYQEAAILRYYAGLDAWALPGVDRADQYDLWEIPWSEHALYVREWRAGTRAAVDPFCDRRRGADVVTERTVEGAVIQRWQVFEVHDCHAAAEPAP